MTSGAQVNRLMELLHDLEERQSVPVPAEPASGELEQAEQVTQLRAELEDLRRSTVPLQEVEALQAERSQLAEQLQAQKQQAQQQAQQLSQFREYQSKAFELKSANDALSEQLEAVNEEIQQMQAEHKEEVEELQKALSTLQSDRQAHHQAVAAQIDAKVKEIRLSLENERSSIEQELQDAKENARVQLDAVSAERDRLQLRVHAQEVEVQALRDVVGDGKEAQKVEQAEQPELEQSEPRLQQVERAKALREQSQFAFDEMTRHLTEIREAGETERKRLQADLDQQLKQRAAVLLEVQNERDSLQTQAEALEQANKAVSLQRDELARQLREKERTNQELSDELEETLEQQKTQQQRYGVLSLVHALQRSTVLPAFSLLRRALSHVDMAEASNSPDSHKLAVFSNIEDVDSLVDTSTGDAGMDDLAEDTSPDASDDEPDEAYGTDDKSQLEWAEMMKANTFESLFIGAETVNENAAAASGELQEHVANIMTSLDFFPQMYATLMQELDRRGFGKELRKFLLLMQRAIGRSVRLANTIAELVEKHKHVSGSLKNLLRSKYLEWHVKSLRISGQHEVLLRFQKNQMAALKADYDDVLDQYGDQCEQNRQVKQQVQDLQARLEAASDATSRNETLQKDLREAREELEVAHKQLQDLKTHSGSNGAVSSAKEDTKTNSEEVASDPKASSETEPAAPAKAKGKGKKGPGPPPVSQDATQPEATTEPGKDQAAGEVSETPPPAAKGKGKGKKGPGPPPPAPSAAEDGEPAASDAAKEDGADAPALPKAKGKGKKGPGPPPVSQPAAEEAPAAAESAPQASEESPAPKAKGKGKKGPGPPPPSAASTASAPAEAAADEAAPAANPAPGKGKGKKGPPMPGAKAGQEPAPGNPEENTQSAEGAVKGKGKPAAPPKGGPKGKAGGKGKVALPDVDPGPEPPKDLVGKKFHWTNVAGNRFAGSMFQQIVENLNLSKSAEPPNLPAAETEAKEPHNKDYSILGSILGSP